MEKLLCKYCSDERKNKNSLSNHERRCVKNPNRVVTVSHHKRSNQYIKAKEDGRPKPEYEGLKNGNFRGKTHTEESKEKLRIAALNSDHRRLKKSIHYYNGVMMDSTWEVELAKRLDNINVKWIRPNPLSWIDSTGVNHHYFPDFYLPEYDLYLDPKNPYAIERQKEKLNALNEQYDNIIIISSLDECKNFAL